MIVDDELVVFDQLQLEWSGILIGNGASLAISDCFAYKSLYEQAKQVSHPLTSEDMSVFEQLNTRNFEQVLSALSQAKRVNKIFELSFTQISEAYERIQKALVESVHGNHVSWSKLPDDTLFGIREALSTYDYVYSTNYDLLTYWAVNKKPAGFRDYFWGEAFDLGNTEVWTKATKLLYLHGALHLYKSSSGTHKRKAKQWLNLLDLFGFVEDGDSPIPLFITEGTYTDKLKSIYNNDYLSFAYSKFASHQGPLVILGQALDETLDKHLVNALRSSPNREVAFGVHRGDKTGNEVVRIKAEVTEKLHGFQLSFFDSATHPLTKAEFHVLEEAETSRNLIA